MKIEPRLSVAQLALTWGVSRQHIYNLIENGSLRAIKIGNLIRVRPEDIAEYEARQCLDQKQNDQLIPSRSAEDAITSNGGNVARLSGYHAALRTLRKPKGS